MAGSVVRVYSESLIQEGREQGTLRALLDEAVLLKEVLASDEEFGRFLTNPMIGQEEQIAILKKSFQSRLSGTMYAFIAVVMEHGRSSSLAGILDRFILSAREELGIGEVYVTVPVPLTPAQEKAVCDKVLETTHYHTVELHSTVDPSLIGGMVIRVNDILIDSSIRTKLETLEKQLMKKQL